MSSATCQRWIVLGLAGTIVWGAGCTATRPGSMPMWNTSWWKKDATGPTTRHDELAPPSSSISPSKSLAAVEPADLTTSPSRKPYQVDGSSTANSGPPTPRSFDLDKQKSTSVAGANQASSNSVSSQPIGAMVPEGKSSEIPDSYKPRYADQSSATETEQATNGDQPIAHVSQDSKPLRYVNPYVNQAELPKDTALPKIELKPTDSGNPANAGSTYTRTPYNAFAPKPSTQSLPVASPLRPMSPSATPAPSTKGLPNIRPIEPAPNAIPPTPTNSGASQSPSESPTSSPLGNSSLPDILLQSQGSYAPGSIRSAQSADTTTPSQSKPFVMPVHSAPPAVTAPPPQNTPPSSSSTLGGGGSFMLSK